MNTPSLIVGGAHDFGIAEPVRASVTAGLGLGVLATEVSGHEVRILESLFPGVWHTLDVEYACVGSVRTATVRFMTDGLAPGEHRVFMRARIPGTDIDLHTNDVTVHLECEDRIGGGGVCSSTAIPRSTPPWTALAASIAVVALRRRSR